MWRTRAGLPSTIMKGGTSCTIFEQPPVIASRPIRQNWWIAVNPPTTARSPTSTCPASVPLLEKITSSPTMQSCAMWL